MPHIHFTRILSEGRRRKQVDEKLLVCLYETWYIPKLQSDASPALKGSSVHVIVLLFVVGGWRRGLLLLEELLPVEGTCRVELQPGANAVQVEAVVLVAWELHH